jgi:hypothetical protein
MLSLTQHLFGYPALGSKEWLKVESYERFVVQFYVRLSANCGGVPPLYQEGVGGVCSLSFIPRSAFEASPP